MEARTAPKSPVEERSDAATTGVPAGVVVGGAASSLPTTTTASSVAAGTNFTSGSAWSDDFWGSAAPGSAASPGANATLGSFLANESAVAVGATDGSEPKFCLEWEAAQHNLFQTANLFFAAAFLVPRSFKQSLLLLRALLCVGFLLSALWAGIHVCSPDVFAWNAGLVLLNAAHSALLGARFLPAPLSPELSELYAKLFRPLRVSRKHFKELAREGRLMRLSLGERYATEDATPADERLSVLLRGRLRVTCDDTHLHFISPHQFIDSPEWEANHSTSDDLFQVTITAEQDCLYLCWSRLGLERVLRHRPPLKTVLDSIIGRDITHKLYSLNEQLGVSANEISGSRPPDHWRRAMARSLSVDAVHTGTKGHVRSIAWQQRRTSSTSGSDRASPVWRRNDIWLPVVANQFPATSPFTNYRHASPAKLPTLIEPSCTSPLLTPPPPSAPHRTGSKREVKFEL